MRASVGQATGPSVQVSPGGARPAQRGGNTSGFDRLLEPAARNHGNTDAKASKAKEAGLRSHERGRGDNAPDALDTLMRAAAAAVDAGNKVVKPSGLDEAQADLPDEGKGAGESKGADDEAVAVPTQIKAEQTISTLMAMVPAARRQEAANDEKAAASGEARLPRSAALAALTEKSQAGERALEAVADEPQGPAEPVGADAHAAGAAKAAASVAANATPNVAAEPAAPAAAGVTAQSPVPASAGKARAANEARDEARTGARTPADAPASQPEPVKAAGSKAAGRDAAGGQPDPTGGNGSGKPPTETRRSGEPSTAGKVSVIGQQAAPAPAPVQLGVNASAVVAAIAGEHGMRAAGANALGAALAFRDAQPMRALKLELHPAELGTVTVNLRTAGERMSVEMQVENHEAYERLSADSDAIVQSLRSLGYDIDRVSIQQPQAATASVQRADQNAATGGFSRDASSFQPGNSGSGSERSAGQNNGQGSRNDGERHREPREIGQDRAGGSLYI